MDYRNSLRTTLYTTRGISLGAIITLIGAIFTQVILTFWIYIIIPIVLVIVYFLAIQIRIDDRLERTDNYSNYIQVLLRKYTSQANPDEKNQFIPFSFTLNYIKRKDQSLKKCLKEFNKAEPTDYLEYKEIPRRIIPWDILGQFFLFLLVISGIIIFTIFAFISGSLQLTEIPDLSGTIATLLSITGATITFLGIFYRTIYIGRIKPKTWAKELTSSRDEKVRFHAANKLIKSKSTEKSVILALKKAAHDMSENIVIRNLAKEALKERGVLIKD